MLIAYAECLLEADINPSMHMFGSCIDIDPVAADMAFIQLSLLGIAAEVVTGNTLTMQIRRVRYTPFSTSMTLKNDWQTCPVQGYAGLYARNTGGCVNNRKGRG
jgi:hypothetical protein